ncbi:MAG: hypothetical protein OT478_19960, partial [Cyanobacteria bacterium FC1]|nr:hypothetical protein [Cyanobacteria bacterium FC1]
KINYNSGLPLCVDVPQTVSSRTTQPLTVNNLLAEPHPKMRQPNRKIDSTRYLGAIQSQFDKPKWGMEDRDLAAAVPIPNSLFCR